MSISIQTDEEWDETSKVKRGEWTSEKIVGLLKTNNTMVYKSLMLLYENRGSSLGFTAKFAEELKRIVDEWKANNAVNLNNVEYIRKLLIKGYTHKLARIANIEQKPKPLSMIEDEKRIIPDIADKTVLDVIPKTAKTVSLDIDDNEVNFLG